MRRPSAIGLLLASSAALGTLLGFVRLPLICWAQSPGNPVGEKQLAPVDASASDRQQQEADRLFARGLELLKTNHAFEARDVLEKAVALDPASAAVHCNLGLAYQNSGNLDRAISEFNQALRLRPSMPEATLNIAGCFQSLGRTQEAIGWYDKFIRENPAAAESTQVKDVVEALKAAAQRPGSDPRLPDYLSGVTQEGTFRWPVKKLPIKIYIDSGAGVEGFRDSFRSLLIQSLDAWMQACQGRLSYVLVDDPKQCDVLCTWTSNPAEVSESGTQSERGMAHVFVHGSDITRATLKILTRPMIEEGTLSDEDFKKACLHEVGHVLGLQGHSTNNHDVMFFTVDTSTVWPVLSKRDKLTINRLYENYQVPLPPQAVH